MKKLLASAYSNIIKPFPGYCLNVIGLIACSVILYVNWNDDVGKITSMKNSATSDIKKKLNIYISDNKGKHTADHTHDDLRNDLLLLLVEDPSKAIGRWEFDLRKEYPRYSHFLDHLKLREVIATANANNISQSATDLANQISEYKAKESPFLTNTITLLVWAAISIIYAIIVGILYYGGGLTTSVGEPVLNIFDVGLYMALIEYSGGFDSPILMLLPISLVVASVDCIRIYRQNKLKWRSLIRLKGKAKALAHFAPTVLYIFALLTGLGWATIGIEMNNPDGEIWQYVGSYASGIGAILLWAGLYMVVIYLLRSFAIRSFE